MNDSPIQEIKNRLDIVDVVKDYITLEKAGSNYRALCPFHSEKTPSFFVNQTRQIWRCFGGCNEGGDMFQFVMKIEGVEFGDALRILAKKAGVELKKQDPQIETKRKRLTDICETSAMFYERQLSESKGGKEAEKYLLGRRISKESINLWRIGYAPTKKDALSKFLIGKGYKREELVQAGISTERGSFDRFRGRVIFPIFNLSGDPVGFGGRTVVKEDERAKYINTPATMLYDKSAIMYGMHEAKTAIRKEGFAVIVEGYTDVILCHQAGYKNVISSSGTALTHKHLDILGRYTKKIRTAFDMDEAGKSATKKGIDMALEKEFDVRIIIMPENEDPADTVSRDSKEWENCVKNAKPVIDFYFQNALSSRDISDPYEKKEAAKELLPEIKKIRNSIERSHFISKLADSLGIKEEALLDEMGKLKEEKKSDAYSREDLEEKKEKKTRRELLEEKVAALCAREKEFLSLLDEEIFSFFKEDVQNILLYLKKEKESLSKKEEDYLNYLLLIPSIEEEKPKEEVKICIREIKKEYLREKLYRIKEEIKRAEDSGDEKKEEDLTKQFDEYSKKMQAL